MSDILLSNTPTAVAITARNQDAFMFHGRRLTHTFDQFCKWRVALDDMCWVQRYVQLLANLHNAFRLVFTAAVRQEDEWDTLLLQESQGFGSAWDRFRGSEKDSINAREGLDPEQRRLVVSIHCCHSLKSKCEVWDAGAARGLNSSAT